MTQTREKQAAGVLAARFGMVVGGIVCLAVTPQFALAYFRAYGAAEGEIANGWITLGCFSSYGVWSVFTTTSQRGTVGVVVSGSG